MCLQVDLHRHLTGSLPNRGVLDILGEKIITAEQVGGAVAPPPMVTPDQGVSSSAQRDAWDLLIRQCEAVQTASASRKENFRRLVSDAVAELARDNVVCVNFLAHLFTMSHSPSFTRGLLVKFHHRVEPLATSLFLVAFSKTLPLCSLGAFWGDSARVVLTTAR